jgi:hypothetical protein
MLKKIQFFLTVGLLYVNCCANIFAQSLPNDSIKPYVDFLKGTILLAPQEYILKSFEEKDIIILCERVHSEFKQYEMIAEVVKDKRFKGNVYTEVGVFNMEKPINDFLKKEGLSSVEVKEQILDIYRNLDYSPLWLPYNYYYLIESIYWANQQRQANDKVQLYPLDIVFSWDSIQCAEQYNLLMGMLESNIIDRDVIMGKHFIDRYDRVKSINPNKKKALVIMNTYHSYTHIPMFLPHPTKPSIFSTGEYIYKTFPNSTKGILINGMRNNEGGLVANGKWDAAFEFTGNKNVGFDLKNTPFGKTKFDMYNFGGDAYETINFAFIFDGFLFYAPIENFEIIHGIPDIFADKKFITEFFRRISMLKSLEESINIEEFNIKTTRKLYHLDAYKEQINRWQTK